jgi:transposase-like protein
MIRNIVVSLLATSLVALTFAGVISYVFEYNFVRAFVLLCIIQFVGFYIYNSIVQTILRIRIEQEQTKQAEYFTKQGVDVTCAHCNSMNYIPVSMEQDNEFSCTSCGKENAVYIDITVAQKTDIIDKQSLTINSYNKDTRDEKQPTE